VSGNNSRPSLLGRVASALGAGPPPEREIFLCTGPDCCRREEGLAAWKHLKQRIREEGLAGAVAAKRTPCMNVCGNGPIAVVYPERTFYSKMNPRGIDAVVNGHLKGGEPDARRSFEPPDDVRDPPHRTHA
jgi:(2Fe-2S) ferredoxin